MTIGYDTTYDSNNGMGMDMLLGSDLNFDTTLDLQKALEAGYGTDPTTQTGGGALRVESLEGSLKVLTAATQHFMLWKIIPKTPAYSTVEEYARLNATGGDDVMGSLLEGELPQEMTGDYSRHVTLMKFFGVTRRVSHPATLVKTITDMKVRENENAIIDVMKILSWNLYWGNSKLGVAGAEFTEFDGLDNIVTTTLAGTGHVIDLQGQPLTDDALANGSEIIQSAYGFPNTLISGPKVLTDFAKQYYPSTRTILPSNGDGKYTAGFIIDQFVTTAGKISLVGDVYGGQKRRVCPTNATSVEAPTYAAAGTVVPSLVALGGSWNKSFGAAAGTVQYRITFCNRKGESTYTASAAQAVIVANQTNTVRLTITYPASFSIAPSYIHVYRTDTIAGVGTGVYRLIKRVACSASAGGTVQVIDDTNEIMPETFNAYLGENTQRCLEFKRLLDIMRMDLAVLSPSYRWMVLLYGALQFVAPKWWVKYINIGDAA
ncbi:MAG: hypothetical protein WC144_06125 [Sulfurimonas sp.]